MVTGAVEFEMGTKIMNSSKGAHHQKPHEAEHEDITLEALISMPQTMFKNAHHFV